jgi:hypothetical protein
MMQVRRIYKKYVLSAGLLMFLGLRAHAQDPSLFLTIHDFKDRAEIANREAWAGADLAELIREASAFPKSYEERFGLSAVELPPEGGQWLHWYVCPDTGTPLTFLPPNRNVCPDTGKEFSGYPLDQVVYQLRNDDLRRAALTLALAYRFTQEDRYAKQAIQILTAYAAHYKSWPLHDNKGQESANGAKAYSQTLDESIWLIDICWTYDLVRGSGLIDTSTKAHIETDLLRASYQTVSKAHKEPTDNIQSWINAAIAAVGYTVHDEALVHEAIDGPIGFRYQMHHFVQQGFWIEGTFGYHFYALRALVATAQMAKRAGLNLWKEEPALSTLFAGPIGVVLPNGELPAFNDSNQVNLFAQDYLYEQAYAASNDPELLPVVEKYGRSNREALLFGVEKIPPSRPWALKSQVFPEAGFAALRNSTNDFTVIAKFGGHGGAHGHYDKLNFVLYSQGRVMGIDPGTQLYGLPLHHQWDSMTIAHNTMSVDESRQAAATGKLISWKAEPDWTAVTIDAGPVYKDVDIQRTIVLTSAYCLLLDHVASLTAEDRTVDWVYHNRGVLTVQQPGVGEPTSELGTKNGYELLHNLQKYSSADEFRARFADSSKARDAEKSNSNSPAATTRPQNGREDSIATGMTSGSAAIELTMPAYGDAEIESGSAPGHNLKEPVPFVLVRRRGRDVRFTSLLSPIETLHLQIQNSGTQENVKVAGPDFLDDVHVGSEVDVKPLRNQTRR